MKIVTLTCQRDLGMALHCLDSLCRYCTDLESLTVFEDGSLSEAGAEALAQTLPGVQVVRRDAMDDGSSTHLAGYPSCQSFRRKNPLALKLIDIPILAPTDALFVDCDIRFFRPFHCAELGAVRSTHFVFMEDSAQGYSARLTDLTLKHRLRMPSKVNTGILSVPPGFHDLDFIEWFLSVPEFLTLPTLIEQTCWAALAGAHPVVLLDPLQMHCATGAPSVGSETVAIHFVTGHKQHVAACRDLPKESTFAPARALRLVPAERLTLRHMLAHSIGRRWRRLRG